MINYGSRGKTITQERPPQELTNLLHHFDPSIRVLAAFEASSYDGFHGDGGSVSIYLIDPAGIDPLIAGIQRYHQAQKKQFPQEPDFSWSEGTRPDLSGLDHLVPKKFQPSKALYRMATTPGSHRTIGIGKNNGYVIFGTIST